MYQPLFLCLFATYHIFVIQCVVTLVISRKRVDNVHDSTTEAGSSATMTTSYERVIATAEETKRRTRSEYEEYVKSHNGGEFHPLSSRVYRQNEKRTSQYSKSNQTSSSHDEVGSVEGGVSTLATEHTALKAAGGTPFIYNTDPQPLIDKPDRYKQKRPCTCKSHNGGKWRPLAEFSERKAKNGKMYPSSWCRACVAAYVQDQRDNGRYKLNQRIP